MNSVNKKFRRIYIDTNVLIGYFRNVKADVLAMEYMFKLHDYELYTSTLAISQTISTLQGKRKDKAYRQQIIEFIKRLTHKVKLIGFASGDIDEALAMDNVDLEDNIQFVLGQKMSCYTYVTNNIKDFRYNTVAVEEPAYIRSITSI